ncbi:alkylresorcinol/alkylpyrone synthase [Thermocatellispora tengchongensis]|uniref:Alkylresorcinol/alkylpyrone synthase n=1 Tax=Thermocatellispora tengchongensis TaxID=1073253 RepID=A0A840PMA0_9ACTN|nr:3-oxoacyl-[acyl-carrier-protein] synthase III C-terminal domain-containing protein [Thermocatellispora tengchongensis]MBB5139133.1 alkylresorcinol/alkylpyrone synthase [Thermocatellispora tengchongensis]
MRVAAVRTEVPPNRYEQRQITDAFARINGGDEALLRRFHTSSGVGARHLALPIEEYAAIDGFTRANDAYIDAAVALGEKALLGALDSAGVEPHEVDHVMLCSSTGVATPSLDARIAQRAGLRQDVKRVPVFGLGCVAGAAGLARTHDYLTGHPGEVAVLVCVELCSLTLQRDDTSPANLVASSLFGDGAAAVVGLGDRREAESPGPVAGPRVTATRSRLYPDTARLMGWEAGGHGLRIVLAADLVDTVEKHLADDVERFLAREGLTPDDIATWVCHPGGPKVIDAVAGLFGLPGDALGHTWRSLRELGNMSSASVLNVLERTMAGPRPEPGEPGLLLALGPGFSAELVLLRW